jgi:hypothetical protein
MSFQNMVVSPSPFLYIDQIIYRDPSTKMILLDFLPAVLGQLYNMHAMLILPKAHLLC